MRHGQSPQKSEPDVVPKRSLQRKLWQSHDCIQRALFSICRTFNVLTAISRREGLVTMHTSRRTALIGLCAGAAQLLFTKRLIAAGAIYSSESTAAPGLLNLALAALTPGILRISISPANDEPRSEELGVIDGTWQELGKAGLEKS